MTENNIFVSILLMSLKSKFKSNLPISTAINRLFSWKWRSVKRLLDNLWIRQLADCQLVEWTSRRLDNLQMPLATLSAQLSFFGHLLTFLQCT